MSSTESAILEFDIIIDAKLSEDTEAQVKRLEELKKSQDEIAAGGESPDGDIKTDKAESLEDKEAAEKLKEFIDTTDKQGLQTLSSFAKNPGNLVQKELLGILAKAGIYGALATSIIALILSGPQLITAVTKALAVKGGPLNQDFHRFFEDEVQVGFSRELQYRRSVGLDVVITSDNRGFLLQDPGFVGNNLVDVDITRAIRNSSNETQYGYVTGL